MAKKSSSLGLNFVVGLSAPEMTREEARLLAQLRPAGVIIFAHNISAEDPLWPFKLNKLIQDVRNEVQRDSLFVSIDHEGGRVNRLPSPATKFPAANRWDGLTPDVGRAMARELRSLGFNLDFAPVLDVLTEERNTVIGDRAFSSNPTAVAASGLAFMQALHSEGVLSCGKHFPGHGNTVKDSHFELPISQATLAELRKCELVPFNALIDAGLPMVMTAHVVYPHLDNANPGTLSPVILNGLLRTELGFDGVIVSDALEMGALSHIAPGELESSALNAGVDLLLVAKPENGDPLGEATNKLIALERAYKDKKLRAPIIEKSQERILSAFRLLTEFEQNAGVPQPALELLGCSEHQRLLSQIKV